MSLQGVTEGLEIRIVSVPILRTCTNALVLIEQWNVIYVYNTCKYAILCKHALKA